MKVLIRQVPAEYSNNLKPSQKIFLSITSRLSDNSIVRKRREKREEKEFTLRAQKEEELKTLLLARIEEALGEHSIYEKDGVIPSSVMVTAPSEYSSELDSVLKSKEFRRYRLEIANTLGDVEFLFEKFPVFIRVSYEGGVN